MGYIYLHKNKINNKMYVGITTASSPTERWGKNGEGYKNSFFYEKGISQFGWDGFDHIILNDDVPNNLLEQVEARLIKELDLTNKNIGYNESEGAVIKVNHSADLLAKNLLDKINQQSVSYEEYLETDYNYTSNSYIIDYLFDLWNKGYINTELDCQRGYVWTDQRQQDMWDTLLRGQIIPEIHTIRSGLNYDVIDGKQRLTTIMSIVSNKIPLKYSSASENIKPLLDFINKKTVYFSELPKNIQNKILNTSLRFCEYSNISEVGTMELFRKLNASMTLSAFGQGIANNIYIRTKYTNYLVELPFIKGFFSEKQQENNDDELGLVRLLVLLEYGIGKVDLQPYAISNKYKEMNITKLNNYKKKIAEVFNNLSYEDGLLFRKYNARLNFFPTILYLYATKEITKEELLSLPSLLIKDNPSRKGNTLNTKTIKADYEYLLNLIKNNT